MANVLASGLNGQLELDADAVTIRRKGIMGFLGHGFKGDKRIPLASITAVQFKEAGLAVNGYLQLSVEGELAGKGGVMQATRDENTVMFQRKANADFDAFRAELESRLAAARSGNAAGSAGQSGTAGEIERLAELHAKGLLTAEEFAAAKRQALGL